MKRIILLCASLLLTTGLVWGQEKYSNEFLKIGVGARAMGMGNTQVALAQDASAGYWNPAGLAHKNAIVRPEVALMYASYFANIANYNYGAFSMPVDTAGRRRFGASLIRLGIDDIPNTLELIDPNGNINLDKVSSFSATDFAVLLSYAWRPSFSDDLSFGANVKVVYRGVGRFANAWGVGLDLGARYDINHLKLGLTLYDITNTFNAWTFNTATFEEAFINTGNEIPQNSVEITRPSARLGIGYDFTLFNKLNVLLALDNSFYFDGRRNTIVSTDVVSMDPSFGLELAYLNSRQQKIAFLRGGVYNLQDEINTDGQETTTIFPTVGAGFVVKNFQIDYALSNIGNLSENLYSHVVSLQFHIK